MVKPAKKRKGADDEEKIKMIATGIPGLDEILKGGVNETSSVLVMGTPGTGKTILAIQFIHEGALRGEPGLYITCEETVSEIKNYAKKIGLDLDRYEKRGLVTFIKQPLTIKKLASIALPLEIIKQKNIKRVVLDSLTFFEYTHLAGEMDYRKEVLDFIWAMKSAGVSLFVISEHHRSESMLVVHKPEDFLFDGLIALLMIRKGASFERCLRVIKMRGQEHLVDIYPFKIDKGGMEVFPAQLPFSLIEEEEQKFRK